MEKKLYYLKQRKPNMIWYYALAHEKGNYCSTKTANRAEAEEYVRKILNGEARGNQNIIFSEFTKDFFLWDKCKWLRYRKSRGKTMTPQTARDRRNYLENHMLPVFGNRIIKSITNFEVDDFLDNLKLANTTKNILLYALRQIFQEAIRQGYIDKNPAAVVTRYSVKAFIKERDVLHPYEIPRLFPQDDEKLLKIWGNYCNASLCYLILTTGMRNGEARALRWSDFIFDDDLMLRQLQQNETFEGGFVRIDRSSRSDNSIGTTKNGKSRAATVIPRAKELLLKHKKLSPFNQSEDFVFTYNRENPVWASVPLNAFRKAMKNAGIDTVGRNLVIHSLRHTFVTLSRGKKINEQLLKDMVGHTDPNITDLYDHNNQQTQLILNLYENRTSIANIFAS